MAIDLAKKKEAAGIVLTKRNIVSPPACEVGVAIDISGSMSHEYENGTVQEIVERILALAMRFDLDGKLDFWTFSSGKDYIGTVSEDQAENYVKRKVLNNPLVSKWGGTDYAPVLKDIYDKYFGGGKGFMSIFGRGKKTEQPVIIFFITDGENSDRPEFEQLVAQGIINDHTIVFNNMVHTKGEFETKWQLPYQFSWQKNLSPAASSFSGLL